MTDWIPVDEATPNTTRNVNIMCEDGVQSGYYSAAMKGWYSASKTWRAVTHWQELPSAPQPKPVEPKVTGEAKVVAQSSAKLACPFGVVQVRPDGVAVIIEERSTYADACKSQRKYTGPVAILDLSDIRIEY